MKVKTISLGILLFLIMGAVFLRSSKSSAPDLGTPNQPVATTMPGQLTPAGHVVADDETPNSPPKQISISDVITPPPVYAKLFKQTPKKLEKTIVIDNVEYPLRTYTPVQMPNDPLAAQAWVTTTKTDQAWDIPVGGRQTVLAIIDTGFALKHEEFSNRLYINAGETGATTNQQPSARNCTDRGLPLSASCNLIDDNSDGIVDNETGAATYQNPSRLNCTDQVKTLDRNCNRIDDDGNGLIDDVQGWDFINNDNSAQAGELNPNGSGTTHGTLVAGVAAATGNNSKGIAGVDWNTKILPIQAISDDSYGDTRSVGQAIYYAAAQKADVISISLGSDLSDDYVRQAVQAAIAGGSVVVAASGNGGCECIVYPANYPEVVAVGALDTSNQRASFSAWGSNLDIVAPGTQMSSTTWSAANPTSAYASNGNGTSFATPLVGGLLTRMLSQQASMSPLQLIAALTENTNRLAIPVATTRDSKLGFGSVDALKATTRMLTPRDTSQLYEFGPISKGNFLPQTFSEIIKPYALHSCPDGTIGTSSVQELIKPTSRFFSISQSESAKAVNLGYSSQFFTYVCLQQPQDPTSFVRNINVFSEFRNIFRPLQ